MKNLHERSIQEGKVKVICKQSSQKFLQTESEEHFDQDELERWRYLAKKELTANIEEEIYYKGDEGAIRRVISILLDNAINYCDPDGTILVKVYGKRLPVITVENTCSGINKIKLDRLFDRFYREDKARTFHGNFGIGLSIAKAIIKQHHGDIFAYKKDATHICFKVILK